MMLLTATWSLGYAALVISVSIQSLRILFRRHAVAAQLAVVRRATCPTALESGLTQRRYGSTAA